MCRIKPDCFAYQELNGKPRCNALNRIECAMCPFYKPKKEVKNNIFYKDSFGSYDEYIKGLEHYAEMFGPESLEDFEKEDN